MPHRDDTDAEALMKRIQYHRYGDLEERHPFLMKKPQPVLVRLRTTVPTRPLTIDRLYCCVHGVITSAYHFAGFSTWTLARQRI
jgi:hypothetical protein